LTYRTPDEVAEWRDRDPIEALGKLLDNDTAQRTAGEVDDVMSDAVAFARQSPEPASESALDFAYADDRVHARGEEC
jgi:pyruvate dehydrogenase E1 component alpha subunit